MLCSGCGLANVNLTLLHAQREMSMKRFNASRDQSLELSFNHSPYDLKSEHTTDSKVFGLLASMAGKNCLAEVRFRNQNQSQTRSWKCRIMTRNGRKASNCSCATTVSLAGETLRWWSLASKVLADVPPKKKLNSPFSVPGLAAG